MKDPETPQPFSRAEFGQRVERARQAMTEERLDALLVTSESNYRYLTGFVSQFWLSPTRPWYFILPREGEPVAIIPEVGVVNMRATSWVERLETWPSPRPQDEGVSLVSAELARIKPHFGRIGAEMGPESRLGIPVLDFLAIRDRAPGLEFVDGSQLISRLRTVKSPEEVDRIRLACRAAGEAFDLLPKRYGAGDTEASLCRKVHVDIIAAGADKAPYLIGVAGPHGYRSSIMGPTERRIERGDMLIIDAGVTFDGYYCDFDRNWTFGPADDATLRAYEVVWKANAAGIRAVRPGATPADVWRAQYAVLEGHGQANLGARMGHGIGLHLTEAPSIRPDEHVKLVPGMVLAVEPGLLYGDGAMMIHEENVVVTEDGCEVLTQRAPAELPIVEGA